MIHFNMKYRHVFCPTLILLFLCMYLKDLSAQISEPTVSIVDVPKLLNYQGFVKDNSGNPIDGRVKMTFRIYDQPTGGTEKWKETQNSVLVRDGQFAVLLGAVTPVDETIFDEPNRYLAVQVESDTEMTPRQKIVSVGYAFRAFSVEEAKHAVQADQSNLSNQADLATRALLADSLSGFSSENVVLRMSDPGAPKLKIDTGIRIKQIPIGPGQPDFSFDNINFKQAFEVEPPLVMVKVYYRITQGGQNRIYSLPELDYPFESSTGLASPPGYATTELTKSYFKIVISRGWIPPRFFVLIAGGILNIQYLAIGQ